MPAKGSVSILWQIIFVVFIPFLDLWAFYRIKKLRKYSSKVFDHLGEVSVDKQTCFIGFMTEDIAQRYSLQKASEIEKIYNTKRIGGVVFCPYDMRKLNNFNFTDIFELFEKHDEIFVLKENEVYKLNVDKTNHAKLFL